MGHLFTNLAVPAADGVGASVDTTAYGKVRTITVQGTFESSITIEFSQDDTNYFPLVTFTNAGKKTVKIAAAYMRVRQSGYVQGAANVDVGSDDSGGDYAPLAVPAGDGVGAAYDVLAFGTFNTIVVSGNYTGTILIEISEDNVSWAQKMAFSGPVRWASMEFVARYIRVRRSGTDPLLAGTATVYVGAIRDPGAVAALGWLNKVGPVYIDYMGDLNDLVLADTSGGQFVVYLPSAATGAIITPDKVYGGHMAIRNIGDDLSNDCLVAPPFGQTLEGTGRIPAQGGCAIYVADGVDTWYEVAVNSDLLINRSNSFKGDQGSDPIDLTDEDDFETDCTLGNYFRLTATADRAMAAPDYASAGHTYMWRFVSSGAGRVITFPAVFKWSNGVPLVTGSGGAGSVDIVTAAYNGTNFDCVGQPNMS